MDLLATRNQYTRWSGGTTGILNVVAGSGATAITLYAPAMQIVKAYGSADRDGFASHTIDGVLTRNGGNDCFKIVQGS
jgi:fructose-specific phosphotransferase system IIC component